MADIGPAGSVVTGLETTAASAESLVVQATPLVPSSTLPLANAQASLIQPQMLLLTGQGFHSPAPTSSQFSTCTQMGTLTPSWLFSCTLPPQHLSSHLPVIWVALWWTSSATLPGPGFTSTIGLATGRSASGSNLVWKYQRQIVYSLQPFDLYVQVWFLVCVALRIQIDLLSDDSDYSNDSNYLDDSMTLICSHKLKWPKWPKWLKLPRLLKWPKWPKWLKLPRLLKWPRWFKQPKLLEWPKWLKQLRIQIDIS